MSELGSPIWRRAVNHRYGISYGHRPALLFHAHHRVHPLAQAFSIAGRRIILSRPLSKAHPLERVAVPREVVARGSCECMIPPRSTGNFRSLSACLSPNPQYPIPFEPGEFGALRDWVKPPTKGARRLGRISKERPFLVAASTCR